VTLGRGGKLAIVTKGPTPYDGEAALRLDGDVAEELSAVISAV
jgi:NAD-dependent deacetylase